MTDRASSSTPAIGDQADHATEVQVGASGNEKRLQLIRKRSKHLRVVSPMQLPADWEIRSLNSEGAPHTRAECKLNDWDKARPCPFLDCKHHLWLSLSSEQSGNPHAGKQGHTRFRPSTMMTCALDVADSGPASFAEIGAFLGFDSTRGRQIAQAAIAKLKKSNPELAAALEEHL